MNFKFCFSPAIEHKVCCRNYFKIYQSMIIIDINFVYFFEYNIEFVEGITLRFIEHIIKLRHSMPLQTRTIEHPSRRRSQHKTNILETPTLKTLLRYSNPRPSICRHHPRPVKVLLHGLVGMCCNHGIVPVTFDLFNNH